MHSGRLAYWAINNLLYVLQMLHKWAVFFHYFLTLGPLGWQAKTQICLQAAFFPWQTLKLPLTAESRSSLHCQFFQMFLLCCSSFLHSGLIWLQWKMMWYNFLFYAWHLGKAIWFVDSKLQKGWGTGNKAWNCPRKKKNFKFGSSITPANKMVNCCSFCCADAS